MENLFEETRDYVQCCAEQAAMLEQQQEYLHQQLLECQLKVYEELQNSTIGAGHCPRVFDGIVCWPPTPAGMIKATYCPEYVVGFNSSALATRQCMEDSTWYWDDGANSTWSNYTACGSYFDVQLCETELMHGISHIYEMVGKIKQISQVGYGVSLVTLLIAVSILATFRRLRCPRNTLHIHLFMSFIMRAFMALVKDNGISVATTDTTRGCFATMPDISGIWSCKLVTSLWQYFIMANYSWILMEGLYLHNLIFLALFTDSSAISTYVVLGWGLPAIFVGSWATCRWLLEDIYCWTTNSNPYIFWIIRGPTALSVVINFIFFLHITWVLLLKLRSSVSAETRKYRKWGKSTLVLMPLFGVHYTVLLWMSGAIGTNETVEVVWLFCDQFFASFQGFFVAVLYCLVNGEVRAELKRRWKTFKERFSINRQRQDSKTFWSRFTISTRTTTGRNSMQSVNTMTLVDRKDSSLSPSPYLSRQTGSTMAPPTLPLTEESTCNSSNGDEEKASPVTCMLEPMTCIVSFQAPEYVPAFKVNHSKITKTQHKYKEPSTEEEADKLI